MRAMGPQAAALRLVVSGAPAADFPARRPAPAPARRRDPWLAAALARTRYHAMAEVRRLRERVRELEAEVAWRRRQLDAAHEAGRRDERARTARTHGGRLTSILTVD